MKRYHHTTDGVSVVRTLLTPWGIGIRFTVRVKMFTVGRCNGIILVARWKTFNESNNIYQWSSRNNNNYIEALTAVWAVNNKRTTVVLLDAVWSLKSRDEIRWKISIIRSKVLTYLKIVQQIRFKITKYSCNWRFYSTVKYVYNLSNTTWISLQNRRRRYLQFLSRVWYFFWIIKKPFYPI